MYNGPNQLISRGTSIAFVFCLNLIIASVGQVWGHHVAKPGRENTFP